MDKFSFSIEFFVFLAIISAGQLEAKAVQQLDYQHDLIPRINLDLAPPLKQNRATFGYQQQQQQEEDAILAPKQHNNNEADVEPSVNMMNRFRLRRSSSDVTLPVFSQYPNNQQLLDDEHAIRLQLPDLIAQARFDKNVERALLKMLINARLRSSMTNSASPYYFNNAIGQISDLTGDQLNEMPQMSAKLEQANDNSYLSGVDSTGLDLVIPQQPAPVDKREYIKPCSFNAVSCAKNPFRKYK